LTFYLHHGAGALTLTKIKDVFAIMKNLVLESSANGSNSSGRDDGNAGQAPTEETERLGKQVKDLKSMLLQRDSEIQILVNMVQKGKTVEDVSGAQMRSSRGSLQGGGDDFSDSGQSNRGPRSSSDRAPGPGAGPAQAPAKQGRSYQEQQQLAQMQREKDNQERILKRHLFGVPPPPDRATFEDYQGKFTTFLVVTVNLVLRRLV
jgi:hypothetical protein